MKTQSITTEINMKIFNSIILIVLFSMQSVIVLGQENTVQKTDTTLFTFKDSIDSYPEFSYKNKKTGKESLCEFYVEKLKYPETQDCLGSVYVIFTIEKDSTLTNIHIYKGIPGCDEYNNEALRLVSLMNHLWKPARKEDKFVRFEMVVPVFFSFSRCNENEK